MTESVTAAKSGAPQQILWLTRRFPFPPAEGGDVLHTRNLMTEVAAVGHQVCGFVLDASGGPPTSCARGIRWVEGGRGQRPTWMTLLSGLPNHAGRYRSELVASKLRSVLRERDWDAVVFDNISTAGYLREVLNWTRGDLRRAVLAYVAHNHERTTHWQLATETRGFAIRAIMKHNALKNERVEGRLARSCDIVAAITESDRELFRRDAPLARHLVIKPGYSGRRVPSRNLSRVGRVAIVLGSFHWIAKRQNLEAFLREASHVCPARSIELRIVGAMTESYRSYLSSHFPWANIVGGVDRIEPELDRARIGVVPEMAGGGFKFKILDYVFSRVAVAAVDGAMAGTMLRPGVEFISGGDLRGLATLIAELIDDVPALTAMTESSYRVCENAYNWRDRAASLIEAISDVQVTH